MKNKSSLPDSYFDDEEFLINQIIDEQIVGVLGPHPSPDQFLKYELCKIISRSVRDKNFTNAVAAKEAGCDTGDISRICNFHLDRFTIDRLIKILTALENEAFVWRSIARISERLTLKSS